MTCAFVLKVYSALAKSLVTWRHTHMTIMLSLVLMQTKQNQVELSIQTRRAFHREGTKKRACAKWPIARQCSCVKRRQTKTSREPFIGSKLKDPPDFLWVFGHHILLRPTTPTRRITDLHNVKPFSSLDVNRGGSQTKQFHWINNGKICGGKRQPNEQWIGVTGTALHHL